MHLKMTKIVNFMFYIVYHNKKNGREMSIKLRLRNPGWSYPRNLLMSLLSAQANIKPYPSVYDHPSPVLRLLPWASTQRAHVHTCPGWCVCFLMHPYNLLSAPPLSPLQWSPLSPPTWGHFPQPQEPSALCVWESSAFAYLKTPLFAFILK